MVSAFDIAKSGIDKGKKFARQYGVNVDFFVADMMEYRLEQNYDIIYASGLLQYIPVKERGRIIDNWKIELVEEIIFACDSSGILHQHCMNVMIARKIFIDKRGR